VARSSEEITKYEEATNDSNTDCCALFGWCGCIADQLRATSAHSENGPEKSGAAKLYRQNCARYHGSSAEGSSACCMMMSGPNLLSAVLRMNAKEFLEEVRHVGETNMCAGNLLDISSGDVEAIRNYLLELSK
jgi:hypothetical protein